MKRRALLFLLGHLAGYAAAQGPLDGYLKGKGVLDLAPSFSFNSADQFDGGNGETFDVPFRGNTLSLFAEYGLSPTLDAVFTAATVFTAEQSGLQDGGIYLKYRPWYKTFSGNHKLGLLLGSGLSFPLSDYDPLETGALGQKAVALPARIIAQWDTRWGPFLNLTGGYTWRLDNLKPEDIEAVKQENPDFVPVDPASYATFMCKIGLPTKHLYTDAWIEWQHTEGGSDFMPNVPDLPQAYGVSYTQIGGTVYFSESGRNGVFLSSGYILQGRNTSRTLRLTVGAVFKPGAKAAPQGAMRHFGSTGGFARP